MTPHEIFTGWLAIAAINTAATMSPGPAFALTVRNAIAYDRRAGVLTALGLAAGVGVLVFLVLFGFAAVLSRSALLFNAIRYAGAGYLVYIGFKALRARPHEASGAAIAQTPKSLPAWQVFRSGLVTNILNPKGMVFFTAVYAQFVAPGTPVEVLALYGATSMAIEAVWFSLVSLVLTDSRVKGRFMRVSHWIERLCGGLLLLLGIRLAVAKGLGT